MPSVASLCSPAAIIGRSVYFGRLLDGPGDEAWNGPGSTRPRVIP